MTTYLLSCDHEIERDDTPPKFVRCNQCVKGSDGYPKRRTVGIVTTSEPTMSVEEELHNLTDEQRARYNAAIECGAEHEDAIEAAYDGTPEPDADVPTTGECIELVPQDGGVTDEQRARYNAAIAAGADEDAAVLAAAVEPDESDDDEPGEMSAAELLDGEQTAAMILERYRLAKIEHVQLATWDGNGDRPATPNLDALKADVAAGVRAEDRIVKTSTTSSTRERKPAKPAPVLAAGEIQYMRNGKPLRGKHNRFSSLAGYCKIPVADLVSQLAAVGFADPKTSPFEHLLSDGTKIAATISGGDAAE